MGKRINIQTIIEEIMEGSKTMDNGIEDILDECEE